MKTETKYICEVCKEKYETEKQAMDCEEKCNTKELICNQCKEQDKHPRNRPCAMCNNFIHNKLNGHLDYFERKN